MNRFGVVAAWNTCAAPGAHNVVPRKVNAFGARRRMLIVKMANTPLIRVHFLEGHARTEKETQIYAPFAFITAPKVNRFGLSVGSFALKRRERRLSQALDIRHRPPKRPFI